MKPFIFSFAFTICISANAQDKKLDSLKSLINGKEDTATVWLFTKIADRSNSNIDSAYSYYQKGLQLAKKIDFIEGQWYLRHDIADLLYRSGNYSQALNISLETLKKAEELNDTMNIYWSMRDVMMTYEFMSGESEQAIKYANKIRDIVFSGFFRNKDSIDFYYLIGFVNHVVDYFANKKQFDSALHYALQSYNISVKLNDDQAIALGIGNLGYIYETMGDGDVAFRYYRMNIPQSVKAGRPDILVGSKAALARLFQAKGEMDSALYYARDALRDINRSTDPALGKDLYPLLSDLYKDLNKYDSSYKYLKLSVELKDSLYSQDKLKEIQTQSFTESLRQQEIAEQKAKEKEERRQNLQMIAIGVFIITFFAFVLLLTHRKKNARAISFLAVLALLMVFEFIAMLAHPYIEEWTHHTPALMLLILVAIASILVPLHHKLEEWMKHRLIMKRHANVDELQEQIAPAK